jgi:hypothetical protein
MLDGTNKPVIKKVKRTGTRNFYTSLKPGLDVGHPEHAEGCGDLYCSSKLAFKDKLEKWVYKPNLKKDFNLIVKQELKPDCYMWMNACNFYLEYDRSENAGIIAAKVESYIKLSQDNPTHYFYVLIICDDYISPSGIKKEAIDKLKSLTKLMHKIASNRPFQFFVTTKKMYDLLPALVELKIDNIFVNANAEEFSLFKLRPANHPAYSSEGSNP